MHLVFLNQYYPPDAAPTGVMLQAVAEDLAAQGHQVTVICAEGGYADVEESKGLKVEDVAAVCDRRSECGGEKSSDGHRPPLDAKIHVLRIRATRFGRGTFVGKVVDYLSYYMGVAWKLMFLQPRPERIVALTTPPYLSVLARVCSKLRGGDHAHWVMDLYPDVMVAHGMLREGSPAGRILAGLARWGFGGRRRAALLTLGPDMAERITALVGTDFRIGPSCFQGNETQMKSDPGPASRDEVGQPRPSDPIWIPLWSDADGVRRISRDDVDGAVARLRHDRGWRDDELVVMYSGNMGLGHRFGEILEVIGKRKVGDQESLTARFVFFGGGKRRREVERFVAEHPEAAVELHDYAPMKGLEMHLRSADVHLASLAAEWTGTMVPSKLQGIFHAARPVIFIGDANSSIGRWVAESGGGWVVAPGDVEGLEHAIEEARDPEARETRGRAAKAFAEANFDKQTNVRRVAEIFAARLECPKPSPTNNTTQ